MSASRKYENIISSIICKYVYIQKKCRRENWGMRDDYFILYIKRRKNFELILCIETNEAMVEWSDSENRWSVLVVMGRRNKTARG